MHGYKRLESKGAELEVCRPGAQRRTRTALPRGQKRGKAYSLLPPQFAGFNDPPPPNKTNKLWF